MDQKDFSKWTVNPRLILRRAKGTYDRIEIQLLILLVSTSRVWSLRWRLGVFGRFCGL